MRNIINPKAPGSHEGLFTLDIGGTSATTVARALENLNGVDKNMVNQVGGPVALDEYGNIPKAFLPKSIKQKPTVSGPTSLSAAATGTYTITNFDSKRSYELGLLVIGAGMVSRNEKTITFTAPDASIVASGGLYGFKLNGYNFPVMVGLSNPILPTPSITSPAQNLSINNSKFTVSYLVSSGNYAGYTYSPVAVDYQVSTDGLFNNIVDYGVDIPVTGNSFLIEGLPQNTECFLRIRQRDLHFGHSDWSGVRRFNSGNFPANLFERTPIINFPIYGDDGVLATDRIQASAFVPGMVGDKLEETEWFIQGVSVLSKTFLTSGQIFRIFKYLESGRTLELKLRYRGSLSNWTEWSQPVLFTMSYPYREEPVLKSISNATFYSGEYTVVNGSVIEIEPLLSTWPTEITLGVEWEVQKVGQTNTFVVNTYGQFMNISVATLLVGQTSGVYYLRPRILTNFSSVKIAAPIYLRKI